MKLMRKKKKKKKEKKVELDWIYFFVCIWMKSTFKKWKKNKQNRAHFRLFWHYSVEWNINCVCVWDILGTIFLFVWKHWPDKWIDDNNNNNKKFCWFWWFEMRINNHHLIYVCEWFMKKNDAVLKFWLFSFLIINSYSIINQLIFIFGNLYDIYLDYICFKIRYRYLYYIFII